MPETLKRLIDMIHFLPGIGEKTAAKLAFFLLKANESYVKNFAETLAKLHSSVTECQKCHGMTDIDAPICKICSDENRNKKELCVVEDYLDMLSIERTGVYRGYYHVLGGAVSPIQNITPEKLNFTTLFDRVLENPDISEIILAMNPNIE